MITAALTASDIVPVMADTDEVILQDEAEVREDGIEEELDAPEEELADDTSDITVTEEPEEDYTSEPEAGDEEEAYLSEGEEERREDGLELREEPDEDIAIEQELTDDDEDTLADRVLEQEHRIYPRVVKWAVDGLVSMDDDGQAVLAPEVVGGLEFVLVGGGL